MRIRVLFLGPSAELAGARSAELGLPERACVHQVEAILADRFPDLKPMLGSVRYAVNECFAERDQDIRAGDEVAVIPPVSGG